MTKKNKKNSQTHNNSKKNYYRNLISDHKAILAKARGLIELLLNKLEQEINEFEKSSSTTAKFWWGDKESASSIIVKLTQILLKLIPLEAEIARADLTKADILELEELSIKTQIPDEDLEIIERYVEKYNENKE